MLCYANCSQLFAVQSTATGDGDGAGEKTRIIYNMKRNRFRLQTNFFLTLTAVPHFSDHGHSGIRWAVCWPISFKQIDGSKWFGEVHRRDVLFVRFVLERDVPMCAAKWLIE